MLWGAVGNALGRVANGLDPAEIRSRFGPDGIHDYPALGPGQSGPRGRVTGDIQLALALGQSLAVTGRLDPDDFARRLLALEPTLRGGGRAVHAAIAALANGVPWWQAGLGADSAGNGAALRAAPVGLAFALDRDLHALVEAAVASAFVTHSHPVGVGGAVVIAAGVAWCAREALNGATALDPQAFLSFVAGTIDGAEPQPTRDPRTGRPTRLIERVRRVADLLDAPNAEEAFAELGNGAFALESVPAALWAFVRSPDDPRDAILAAVNAGHDADTVALLTGSLAGAWSGARRLEDEAPGWLTELELHDEIVRLADRLAEVASR
jgi:ADP-ribosylglycohydrolase